MARDYDTQDEPWRGHPWHGPVALAIIIVLISIPFIGG